jgi:hypothetical protein
MSLDDPDIALIKGMLERGDRQSDIAAWFGVNAGRIAEISTGQRGADVPLGRARLPPRGPYVVVPKRFVDDFRRLFTELQIRDLNKNGIDDL